MSSARGARSRVPIAKKLILSYLLIIAITIAVFGAVGMHMIGRLTVSEAQAVMKNNLNAAREILQGRLGRTNDIIRLTSERFFLKEALAAGNLAPIATELVRIREMEQLDVLTVTDRSGVVLFRASNPGNSGDDRSRDELVAAALHRRTPVSSIALVSAGQLRRESPALAEQARIVFVPTAKARSRPEAEEGSGMMLLAAAPIMDGRGELQGVLYGGVLLNRNYAVVDKIKDTVFANLAYRGREIGTATIFLDDVRITTNVRNEDGTRAVGTRISEDVYQRVVLEGRPWIDRAFVVNDWYITSYEPIRAIDGRIIGILYVGMLEERYVHMKWQTVLIFLGITAIGALLAAFLSYLVSRRVTETVRQLDVAANELAHGNLDASVQIDTNDELQDLADAFNVMTASLKKRDEQLKDYARMKIMESERLAITGQLAAGVAHELNNPLQGIVAYSHLLLEGMPPEDPGRPALLKIVNQADRCRGIVRGLLDFSRPRRPHKRTASINGLLNETISLVEHQALFHNIAIIRRLQENLPQAVVDPSQLQEVFINIIINAAEAMDGVGSLTLTTRLDRDGETIEIQIADTGHGVCEEDMPRLFDPFFTTKEPGHGTGLGLAISHNVIHEHDGSISVTSEVGKGTTFSIRIPIGSTEGEPQGGESSQDIDNRRRGSRPGLVHSGARA